jgi:hypothetical protein
MQRYSVITLSMKENCSCEQAKENIRSYSPSNALHNFHNLSHPYFVVTHQTATSEKRVFEGIR